MVDLINVSARIRRSGSPVELYQCAWNVNLEPPKGSVLVLTVAAGRRGFPLEMENHPKIGPVKRVVPHVAFLCHIR
jgi:hypothetical protein